MADELEPFIVTQHPSNVLVNPMDSAWMACNVNTNSSVMWQWYVKPRYKTTFAKIVDSVLYSGSNTRILNIPKCDVLNGSQYRCVITRVDDGRKVKTAIATLTADCATEIKPPEPQ